MEEYLSPPNEVYISQSFGDFNIFYSVLATADRLLNKNMKLLNLLLGSLTALSASVKGAGDQDAVKGIRDVADRWLQGHGDSFIFELTKKHENWSRWNTPENDNYTITSNDGKIHIQGTTLSALARG